MDGMPINWRELIVASPVVLHGKLRIMGTRIPVSLILGYLGAGYSQKMIIEEFLDITNEQIAACLDYARDLAESEMAA